MPSVSFTRKPSRLRFKIQTDSNIGSRNVAEMKVILNFIQFGLIFHEEMNKAKAALIKTFLNIKMFLQKCQMKRKIK